MATRVDPCARWLTPGGMPNGLQATPEGLWVIDQIDPNDIYLLDYADGRELLKLPTRALHSSGITIDPSGNIWVSSTFTYEVICFDRTGRELVAYPTPPYDRSGGAHGIEWRDGNLWFNVPITGQVFVMDPASGAIVRSIPAPGDRSHGVAWDPFDAAHLWLVDTNRRVIVKLDTDTGQILNAVGCSGPEPHGMTIWQGDFWLCDAESRQVVTFPVPKD
jgi:streptogramin lyase